MDTQSFPILRFKDGFRRDGGTTKSEGTLARLSVDFQQSLKETEAKCLSLTPTYAQSISQLHEQEDALSMWSPDAHAMPASWALTQVNLRDSIASRLRYDH